MLNSLLGAGLLAAPCCWWMHSPAFGLIVRTGRRSPHSLPKNLSYCINNFYSVYKVMKKFPKKIQIKNCIKYCLTKSSSRIIHRLRCMTLIWEFISWEVREGGIWVKAIPSPSSNYAPKLRHSYNNYLQIPFFTFNTGPTTVPLS
jgi:hypothetical protein